MNIGLWAGFGLAAALLAWGIAQSGAQTAVFNPHGLVIVLGGTLAAMLINCPVRDILQAAASFGSLFLPQPLPSVDAAIAELVRLARKSQSEGGLLSLRDEGRAVADGFLHRAITVAVATGEAFETRRVLESEIRQLRLRRQEDANIFRTAGVLAPMFGLLGTLLGMVRVLETMSDPAKIGPAMALALSSAFFGIGFANFICVPVAGQIRLRAIQESLVLELVLEGVLDLAAGKPPYLVELHLASYSRGRRNELEAAEAAAVRPAPAR